ncbi:MAG: hypothetical protein SV966_03640 [Actinomycetota bacterium]|nr:hypothetical protein [Actinomycetota bacterium]
MDLRWWPIAVIGLLSLLVCFALALLRHFARQAGTFENERIGLTSQNTRRST